MRRGWWPVVLVVALQLGGLALLALRPARARASGLEITLRTMAVDPYDPLAGRYIVLRYEVERDAPPAGTFTDGQPVWIVVERAEPAWRGVAVVAAHEAPSPGRLALRATWRHGAPTLEDASRLYLNEELCLEADELLRAAPAEGLVDLAVDELGNLSPLRLHVAGRVFAP